MASNRKHTAGQTFLRAVFVVYALWMLWLLFGQRWGTEVYTQQLAESMNLKPFATIKRYIALLGSSKPTLFRHAVINLVGNVVMFVPLGFFLPGIFPGMRRFFRAFFLSLGLILTVELVQYFTMLGTCDIDDLILNMVGICIGYLFGKIKKY